MYTTEERVKIMWKYLNENGIYTEEQLDEALERTKLDIGIFVTPINKDIKLETKNK